MSSALPPDVPTPVEAPVGVGETHASTVEPAHGPEEAGGLPQFEFQHWGGQIVYLLFLFALLYLLMAKVFGPRMRRIFDEREQTIAGAIAQARQVQAEAEAQAEAAQAEIAEARAQSKRTAAAAKARVAEDVARRQAEQEAVVATRIAEAEGRIGKTRDAAMASVAGIATETTREIVQKLTGKAASPAEAAAAVKGAA